jgi:hypothetical protein
MSDRKLTIQSISPEIAEDDVRRWFACVDLEQAGDTLNVCRGIIEGRQAAAPKRQRRSDAGKPRPAAAEQTLDLREVGKPL